MHGAGMGPRLAQSVGDTSIAPRIGHGDGSSDQHASDSEAVSRCSWTASSTHGLNEKSIAAVRWSSVDGELADFEMSTASSSRSKDRDPCLPYSPIWEASQHMQKSAKSLW